MEKGSASSRCRPSLSRELLRIVIRDKFLSLGAHDFLRILAGRKVSDADALEYTDSRVPDVVVGLDCLKCAQFLVIAPGIRPRQARDDYDRAEAILTSPSAIREMFWRRCHHPPSREPT